MPWLPPSSTLFPYTTLFRSRPAHAALVPERGPGARSGAAARGQQSRSRRGQVGIADHEQDRKSTRLNSSHSQISYAVFCLKKKNKTLIKYLRMINKIRLTYV